MIRLEPTERDDAQYVELVSLMLNSLIQVETPQEVYIIQIDHWFDHKWKRFSGKVLGALGVWKSTVTLPPFDPGRVISQQYYRAKDPSTLIYDLEIAKPLHLDQWAAHNLQRYVKHVSKSGLFLW